MTYTALEDIVAKGLISIHCKFRRHLLENTLRSLSLIKLKKEKRETLSKNNYCCRTDGSEHEEHEAATESQVKRDGNDSRQAIDHRISRISGVPAEVRRRARATVASATIELRLRSQWPAIGLVSSFQFRWDRVLNSLARSSNIGDFNARIWTIAGSPMLRDNIYRPSVTSFPLSTSGKRERERESNGGSNDVSRFDDTYPPQKSSRTSELSHSNSTKVTPNGSYEFPIVRAFPPSADWETAREEIDDEREIPPVSFQTEWKRISKRVRSSYREMKRKWLFYRLDYKGTIERRKENRVYIRKKKKKKKERKDYRYLLNYR